MDILKWIAEQNLIIVAVLYVIGMFIKNGTKMNNAWIPFLLTVVAALLMFLRNPVITPQNAYDILTQAFLVAGGAVLINEGPKQLSKLRDIKKQNPNLYR